TAVLQKTNKNTGKTTNLTNSTGSNYSYLNHANDMDVTTIDGYSQLFVATMATGSNSLVRIKVDGSKATKSGGYTLMYNGAQKSVSGVSIERTDANNVYFLFKSGATVYRGSVAKSATSGVINITKAFNINTSSVKINGSYLNLSSYTHQGMGYHDGKIYVPLWGGGAEKSNQSIIAVYDTYNAFGTVNSDPFLSFRVTSGAYSGFEIESCNVSSDGQLYFNVNRWTSSSGNHDAILRFNGYVANGFNPDGYVDAINGGVGTVNVRGWTFDKDCAAISIPVHVYIGGPAGSGEGHAITANTTRTDVNSAFGCGNYHGFDATISTSLRGSQPVYIYAINTRKGSNVCIGSGWVNITNETNAPGIANVRVTEVSDSGYRVTCDVWDDSGITSVKFPTWTANNGQDDLIWHEGTVSGNTATCYISRGDHKGEYVTYITHIYAYDPYGNQSCNSDTNVYLEKPLSIYDCGIADLGTGFYAKIVNVNANKDVAVDCRNENGNVVIFDKTNADDHIWRFDRYNDGSYRITNTYNGKCLDLAYAENRDGANVQIYDNNESPAQKWYIYNYNGCYALKAACSDRVLDVCGAVADNFANIMSFTFHGGNNQLFTIDKIQPTKAESNAPVISNITISEVSANGYRVTCDISDESPITSVKFPTWTENNGQDDLIWHIGQISGNKATFYVNASEHKGEVGKYITHIYAYDVYGNASCVTTEATLADIVYSGHVQNIGDVAPVSNWAVLGT
ncbi:MAG: RICIN domain-containing protein, partial [Acutalibacteraceae bacterium]